MLYFENYIMLDRQKVKAAIARAYALIDYNIHDGIHKQQEFLLQTWKIDQIAL